MAAGCELDIGTQMCDVLAVARCSVCTKAFCGQHRYAGAVTPNQYSYCAECGPTQAGRDYTSRQEELAAMRAQRQESAADARAGYKARQAETERLLLRFAAWAKDRVPTNTGFLDKGWTIAETSWVSGNEYTNPGGTSSATLVVTRSGRIKIRGGRPGEVSLGSFGGVRARIAKYAASVGEQWRDEPS